MNKEKIKKILLDNQEIDWKNYIRRDKVLPYTDLERLNKVVAILGPRRSGKTYFLRQIITESKLQKEQIVFFDFSEVSLEEFKPSDFELVLQSYYELFPGVQPFFFLDEIQELSGFESGLKFLLNKGYQIYMTGSSSQMIVKDLAASLRGKVMNFFLYPLSFSEYLQFKGVHITERQKMTTKKYAERINMLTDFLKWGGFPEVVLSKHEETKINLLSSYIDVMLFRDIIERYSVKNIYIIDKLFWKIVRSFTKEISINKWYNDFKSQGLKVSKDTLYLYLKYFEDSFFVYFVSNSTKGATGFKKAYLVDNGIYNHVRSFPPDKGKTFENAVFLDLLRQGKTSVKFFRTSEGEADFITDNETFQVCFSLTEENKGREIRGLELGIRFNPGAQGRIIVFDETGTAASTDSALPYLRWIEGHSIIPAT